MADNLGSSPSATDFLSLLKEAEDHCNNGRNEPAESILNQLVLKGFKKPLVFHLLGTIYYDQGKFNKAIRAFQRALEIDPGFTDSSVGLSIILNDLGRYDEGRKVFEEAKAMLSVRNREDEDLLNEKLAVRHDALGDIYFQHGRYKEALREFQTASDLSPTNPTDFMIKSAQCFGELEDVQSAIETLEAAIDLQPDHVVGRIRLGKLLYDSHRVASAINEWETVLNIDPENAQAKDYLRLAKSLDNVRVEL